MVVRTALFIAALAAPVFASPASFDQVVLGGSHISHSNEWQHAVDAILDDGKKALLAGKNNLEKWWHDGKEFVKKNDLLYELVSHPSFDQHQLRVTEPEICDTSVQQYSGYLDIAEDKHLFFWFFESRFAPEEAPLILWLNGGPGCSSSTGLLFELGPCRVADESGNLTHNKYSWNNHANMIFLDQPVNVGFSYAEPGTSVSDSTVSAEDVYAFLEIFLNRYPKYASAPFHVAAESYGGHYGPHIVSEIYKKNKELALRPLPGVLPINLVSLVLANGLTDPYIQHAAVPDYVCNGPYPVYDDPDGPECQNLRSKVPTCQRLTDACYKFKSRLTCVPAIMYCNSNLFGPLMQTGLNPYDVRMKCDRQKDGDLCYKQMNWIDTFMNKAKTKASLGVDRAAEFASCNMDVNQAFALHGDGAQNSAELLPELINDGMKLLVYAGNADMMCNYMGNERWVEQLETKFSSEFRQTQPVPWVTLHGGRRAGEVRTAGGSGFTAGNVTFVNVFEAGHMVPYDQPEAALDLISRWIFDVPLVPSGNEYVVL
ncbi:carboxypeptidase C [Flagelloscypha sp. PMI_526]|nr:carboxypeptidase C [Flagelloscypha sp. PMI_526]